VWWGVEGKEIESYDDTSAALLVKLQDEHPVKEINLHGFPFGFLDLGRLCCQSLGWSPVTRFLQFEGSAIARHPKTPYDRLKP
jgi:hypothetical protein